MIDRITPANAVKPGPRGIRTVRTRRNLTGMLAATPKEVGVGRTAGVRGEIVVADGKTVGFSAFGAAGQELKGLAPGTQVKVAGARNPRDPLCFGEHIKVNAVKILGPGRGRAAEGESR